MGPNKYLLSLSFLSFKISLAHRNRGAKSMAAFGPKSAIAAMPAQIGSNRGR